MAKRERTTNFSGSEKVFLIEQIEQSKHIIENVNNNIDFNKRKNSEWILIQGRQNEKFPDRIRSVEQIRNLYKKIKMKAKQEMQINKKCRQETGGGPAPQPVSELSQAVLEMVPSLTHTLVNDVDDDADEELHESQSYLAMLNESVNDSPSPGIASTLGPQQRTPRFSGVSRRPLSQQNPCTGYVYKEHLARMEVISHQKNVALADLELKGLAKQKLELEISEILARQT